MDISEQHRHLEADVTTPDFHALCRSLLQAIDAGNLEAEESVLCRIRVAVREAEQAGHDTHTTTAREVER